MEDITKRYLEVLKQGTTFDTAVALVALAARQAMESDPRWVVPVVIGACFSLLFAIGGLVLSANQRLGDDGVSPTIPWRAFNVALWGSLTIFFLGLFGSLVVVALGFWVIRSDE